MDDEQVVREVASEMLLNLGYEVVAAADGSEVLELYGNAKREETPFDAVILDLTVPGGMGGKEALEKLQQMDPSVKAVVSSGFANDPIMANYEQYGFSGVVPKPYTKAQLSEVLNKIFVEKG